MDKPEDRKLRESFKRIRQDMGFFFKELHELKRTLQEIKSDIQTSTDRQTISTHSRHTTDTSTNNYALEAPKTPNLTISTGNGGVSTDRQTHRQTDRHNLNEPSIGKVDLEKVSELIDSFDNFKTELASKFCSLTKQEMVVFATIYQLEEERADIDYQILAKKLSLTESSVRDHVSRMIKKGIPLDKSKENNKKIILSVSPGLKKIASLDAIIKLREAPSKSFRYTE